MAMESSPNLDSDFKFGSPLFPGNGRELVEGSGGGYDRPPNFRPFEVPVYEGELIGRFSVASTTTNPAIPSTEDFFAENRGQEYKISTTVTPTTLENGSLTEREKIILISTIVPAVAIILILSVLLAYFIFKRQRNTRVGAQIAKEEPEEQGGSNGQSSAGRLPRSQSARGLGRDNNGTTNGAKRAWEGEERTIRHETETV